MLITLILMCAGILTGYFLRNKTSSEKPLNYLILGSIFVLLFLLGVSVGNNPLIINNISRIGFEALCLTVGAVGGSILMAWLVYNFYFKTDED